MRRAVVTAITALSLLALTGCVSTPESATSNGNLKTALLPLPEGGEVLCVFMRDGSSGAVALTCDWEGTR